MNDAGEPGPQTAGVPGRRRSLRKRTVLAGAACLLLLLVGWGLFKPLGGPDRIPLRPIDFLGTAGEPPTGFGTHLTVAVCSFEASREKELNVAAMERIAQAAKADHPDLRLVVFGEASLGLYHDLAGPAEYQRAVAEPIPGPASERLGALARRLGVYLAYGAIESEGDTRYNALAVIDPGGRVVARHRKMLLHALDEAGGITVSPPNDQVVDVDGFKCGLAICADANSRWLCSRYVAQGIDVLLCPVTSNVPGVSKALRYWPHAKHYGAWILAANRYGVEGADNYPGTVFVAAPNGRMCAVGDVRGGYVAATIGK